jgi:hypothetical protein
VLVIRSDQMRLLQQSTFDQFKVELVRHLATFAPELHTLRGDAGFRTLVDAGLRRAAGYGFSNRGPLRFFAECMLSHGAEFDTDPQLRGLFECLTQVHDNGQAWHAGRAFATVERYQIQARGRHNQYAIQALRRVPPFLDRLDTLSLASLEADLLALMRTVQPEKVEFVGSEGLRRLVAAATQQAERAGVASAAGIGLLCGLMFALGHGVARDPMYPWVGATLERPSSESAQRRVERLRRKTRRYLGAVLKHLADG